MFIPMSKQPPASKAFVMMLSGNALENGSPNLFNTIACSSAHESHHALNAMINFLSDKKVFTINSGAWFDTCCSPANALHAILRAVYTMLHLLLQRFANKFQRHHSAQSTH